MSAAATIANGSNVPIDERTGTIPDVSGALRDWFQPMTFIRVTKSTVGFQLIESESATAFRGLFEPYSGRPLEIRSEGERAWTSTLLHSDPVLPLQVDDRVTIGTIDGPKMYRVMALWDYTNYGFMSYHLLEDYGAAEVMGQPITYTILQYGMTMPPGG